jgi:hypothetical protein
MTDTTTRPPKGFSVRHADAPFETAAGAASSG